MSRAQLSELTLGELRALIALISMHAPSRLLAEEESAVEKLNRALEIRMRAVERLADPLRYLADLDRAGGKPGEGGVP